MESLKVGDVIYEHGIVIITSGGITGSVDGYYGHVQLWFCNYMAEDDSMIL
jgi:hypothetical protein